MLTNSSIALFFFFLINEYWTRTKEQSWTFHALGPSRFVQYVENSIVASLLWGFSICCCANSIIPSTDLFLFFLFPMHCVTSDGSSDKGEPNKEWEDNQPRSYTHRQTVRRWTWHHMVESPEEKKKQHQGEDLSTTIFLLPFPSLPYLVWNLMKRMKLERNTRTYWRILRVTGWYFTSLNLLLDHFHSPGFPGAGSEQVQKKKKN